jgi:biopolymer transport protein ExbB/TolQ
MLATLIDRFLLALAALTAALIVYKTFELTGRAALARTDPVDAALERLERGMPLLASVAGAAPFVGLAATVLHIIDALGRLGAGADIAAVSAPIAAALHSTLLGLASAVPALVAYNLLQRRLQILENRARREAGSARDPS